jgi:two-component system, OmpR family, response regulator CpxR
MADPRILVIDDDAELADLLATLLTGEGFVVETANDGKDGLGRARAGGYALVVLDVMLPEMNGFEVLRRLRETSRVPVLMLTARGEDVDRIVGLEMGADDYLPKPFNARELVARIRAIQRRASETGPEPKSREEIAVGDLTIVPASRSAKRAGEELPLTSVEFTLLEVLVRSAGSVVSREDLSEKVLGRKFSPFDRSIDVHVSNLRKKLGPLSDGTERIKTVRSIGYQYSAG